MNRTVIRSILTAIIAVNMSCYICGIGVWLLSPANNIQDIETPIRSSNTPIDPFGEATNTPINPFNNTSSPTPIPSFTPFDFPTASIPTAFIPPTVTPFLTSTNTFTPFPSNTPFPTLSPTPTVTDQILLPIDDTSTPEGEP